MEIAKTRIQMNKIVENDSKTFIAFYGSRKISITSIHNYGIAICYSDTRFDIVVEDEETGETLLNQLYDCKNIKEAIRFSIKSTER